MPRVQCDFDSAGLGSEEDDECYYTFDEKPLAQHRIKTGMRVFIYEPSRDGLVMGCEAELEQYRHAFSNQLRWRLRPVPNTGYLGQLG